MNQSRGMPRARIASTTRRAIPMGRLFPLSVFVAGLLAGVAAVEIRQIPPLMIGAHAVLGMVFGAFLLAPGGRPWRFYLSVFLYVIAMRTLADHFLTRPYFLFDDVLWPAGAGLVVGIAFYLLLHDTVGSARRRARRAEGGPRTIGDR